MIVFLIILPLNKKKNDFNFASKGGKFYRNEFIEFCFLCNYLEMPF
jgi:hypothetical protein